VQPYATFPSQPRILSETPRFAAIAVVAATVRFNVLAILVTPCLFFAIDFNVRKSFSDHGLRNTAFLFFISVPIFFANRFSITRLVHRCLNFWLGASLGADLTNKQRSSSIWQAKSIAFAFNTSIA
jgi:hypothetical protein